MPGDWNECKLRGWRNFPVSNQRNNEASETASENQIFSKSGIPRHYLSFLGIQQKPKGLGDEPYSVVSSAEDI
ncbi:hypothetical protein NPIL_332401 [Nephila pilipes]|uniref:Uncharacterized protein n=1 Tax=Nephila pilipes TaxID=299642 RepID=A0A8X6MU75_NEPPI|nr:hypothetical protein NPIL_332401 [Nephila pilipes]